MIVLRNLPLLALLLVAAPTLAAAPPAAVDSTPEWRYTVRPGDTLIGVSKRYLVRPAEWPRVQRYNRIVNPHFLLPGSGLRIPLAWLRHAPAPVAVVSVAGRVRVSLPDAAERALQPGEQLVAGAALSTASDSSVTLRFADGSLLTLQPNAQLVLDSVSVYADGGMVDTQVRLQQGRVEVGANPKHTPGSRLQVITPSAVAAVRGTRFRVEAGADVTREETLDGGVALIASGVQVKVGGGQGSLAELGKPPLPPVALLSAPDVSALPVRIDSLPMRFAWPALPGAVTWLGQIAPNAAFDQVLLEKTNTAPQVSFADLPDGHYVLRVRGADVRGLQGHDAQHAFDLDARPFAPLLSEPGARVREANPTLKWTGVVGASAYKVELARDAGFADRLVSERVADTRLPVSNALLPGDYYWRVATIEQDEQGPFSPPQRFVYDPLPGAPDLNKATPVFANESLTLAMPAPAAGLHYDVVLAHDAGLKQIAWQGTNRDGKLVAAPVEPLNHFLAVRLVEADGTAGPYAIRMIDAPPRNHWAALWLLLPLLAIGM